MNERRSKTIPGSSPDQMVPLEFAYFGKYVARDRGAVTGDAFGYLRRSNGFPEAGGEIDDWVRAADKIIEFDESLSEAGAIFMLFSDAGFWCVKARNYVTSDDPGRSTLAAHIWFLPKAQTWFDLPVGVFRFLLDRPPVYPPTVGDVTLVDRVKFTKGLDSSEYQEFLKWLAAEPGLQTRLKFLDENLQTKGKLPNQPIVTLEEEDETINSRVIGTELDVIRMLAEADGGPPPERPLVFGGQMAELPDAITYTLTVSQKRESGNVDHAFLAKVRSLQTYESEPDSGGASWPISRTHQEQFRMIDGEIWKLPSFRE